MCKEMIEKFRTIQQEKLDLLSTKPTSWTLTIITSERDRLTPVKDVLNKTAEFDVVLNMLPAEWLKHMAAIITAVCCWKEGKNEFSASLCGGLDGFYFRPEIEMEIDCNHMS